MSRSAATKQPPGDHPPLTASQRPDCQAAAPLLTDRQRAAVAKLAYGAAQPGAIAVLCGPAGVGKTTVLRVLAGAGLPEVRTRRVIPWADIRAGRGPAAASDDDVPDVLILDDADRAVARELGEVVERFRGRCAGIAIVLAGAGRLLSLVAGDARLEQPVRLRVALPTFTLADSRRLLATRLPVDAADAAGEAVIRTIHEIAGGVPAVALRLADVAAMLAAADPGRGLTPDDVETVHRRLSLAAA